MYTHIHMQWLLTSPKERQQDGACYLVRVHEATYSLATEIKHESDQAFVSRCQFQELSRTQK